MKSGADLLKLANPDCRNPEESQKEKYKGAYFSKKKKNLSSTYKSSRVLME